MTNQFIDDIVKTIEYLVKTIALAVGAIADALEVARVELICLKYRERRLNIAHTTGKYRSEYDNQRLKSYHALTEQIEQKTSERNEALKESKRFFLKADRRAELTRTISKLTNEIEDLESRRNMILECRRVYARQWEAMYQILHPCHEFRSRNCCRSLLLKYKAWKFLLFLRFRALRHFPRSAER